MIVLQLDLSGHGEAYIVQTSGEKVSTGFNEVEGLRKVRRKFDMLVVFCSCILLLSTYHE